MLGRAVELAQQSAAAPRTVRASGSTWTALWARGRSPARRRTRRCRRRCGRRRAPTAAARARARSGPPRRRRPRPRNGRSAPAGDRPSRSRRAARIRTPGRRGRSAPRRRRRPEPRPRPHRARRITIQVTRSTVTAARAAIKARLRGPPRSFRRARARSSRVRGCSAERATGKRRESDRDGLALPANAGQRQSQASSGDSSPTSFAHRRDIRVAVVNGRPQQVEAPLPLGISHGEPLARAIRGWSRATPPARGDAAMTRWLPSALDGVLEPRAGREARGLGGGDLHRLARGRVGALARVAVGDGELPEASDGDVLAGGQAVLDGGDGGAQRLAGLALAQARPLCDLLDEARSCSRRISS